MSSIELVWERIKFTARERALKNEALNIRQARELVCEYARAARVDPWPPSDVIDFFAAEMIGMVETAERAAFVPAAAGNR